MILQPGRSAVETEGNEAINRFTEKYGIHGTLFTIESHALIEVRQIDFTLRDYMEDMTAIPWNERQAYTRALMESGLFLTAVGQGRKYNVPVGEGRWIKPDEPTYAILKRLPVLGYV